MAYIASSNQMFSTAADLRLQAGQAGVCVQLLGISAYNDGLGGQYYWDDISTLADDNFSVFAVTGVTTGRWMKVKNSNVLKSGTVFSAAAATLSYTVTHGLGFVPAMIILTPTSLNAAALSYISAKTSTTFTVTFLTVPPLGVNNISFDYLIIKT